MLAGITIIFTLAWVLTVLLRRSSAALRHLVWTCAFAAVLLLAPLRYRAPHRYIAPAITVPSIPAIATPAMVSAGRPAARIGVEPSTLLIAAWALGAAILMLRLILNAIRLRSIMGAARGRPPILNSARVKGPLVAGWWRPVILLPENAASWSVSRRRAVLAHEAAHIRRYDPAILLAAQVATALYWFHPLTWLAAARLRAESERACDDTALRLGLRPSGYAGHLLELACRLDAQLAIPMATTSHLESRVKSILDPKTNRNVPSRAVWFAAVALTAALLSPLAILTVRAQSFGNGGTIEGIVSDPTGACIPNAQVTVIGSETGARQSTTANATGGYAFTNLAPGYYTVEVRTPGFAPFRLDNQAVVAGGKLEADAHLIVGHLTERLTVAAQGTPKIQAAPKVSAAGPVRVGGNVQAARITRQVSPDYPEDLRTQGIEGTVVLSAIVSKEGVPIDLKILQNGGNAEFATAAIDAVRQWSYQPTLLNGMPIDALTTIQIDFKLSAQAPIIYDPVLPVLVIDDRLLKFK